MVFYELLLHAWIGGSFAASQILPLVLFALALGGVQGALICCLPSTKWQKWCSAGLALLAVVYMMTEYCLNESFRSFMPPAMIFHGAGGVANGFMDVVVTLIVNNWWKILLMLAPIAAFLLLVEPDQRNWKHIGIYIGSVLFSALLAVESMFGLCGSLEGLTSQFDYSVRSNGLLLATFLELTGANAQPQQEIFVPVELPTVPAQTHPDAAESTEPPREHVLDFDFAAHTGNDTIGRLNAYVASQKPSTDNEYTGLFAGKNLIFISAEAFTSAVIDPERTPALYRMATQGIRFTDYYQPGWNGGTSGGEVANLSGLVPNPSSGMHAFSDQKPFITIGHQLQKLGYFSRAYHNNTGTFYDRNKTHTNLGYDKFIAMYSGMEEGVVNEFPQSDREMIDFTVPQYIDQQPFSVYYMSVSGHSVYDRERHSQAKKNYDLFADMDYSEPIKCYLAANQELEYAMERLLEQLEEAGILNDTVVVISADHYPYGLDAGTAWGHTKDCVQELFGLEKGYTCIDRDHNTGIIWSGCLEGKNITVDAPASSIDLLPTLDNLFGIEYDSRLLAGRDVFSDALPLVLWPNGSWVTDLGAYSVEQHAFTPRTGPEIPDGYVESVSAIVRNKIYYSQTAISSGYFRYLANQMDSAGISY